MSKKILEVEGSAKRVAYEYASGSFHSSHKPEDIEKWLQHEGVEERTSEFDDVFGDDWNFDFAEEGVEDFKVEFTEVEDSDEVFFEFEENIQKFIDEEPQRERDAGVHRISYQLKDMIGNFDGIKDTSIKLFEDYLDLIEKTGVGKRRENKKGEESWNLEKCNEEEKKLFYTLRDLVQLTLKFPKPEVEKGTYEPF